MEKPKFEFQKLELPKQVNSTIKYQSTNEKVDNGIFMDTDDAPKISTSKNKQAPYIYFILFTLIGFGIIYYIHEWDMTLRNILKNTQTLPKVRELSKNSKKEVINPTINVNNIKKTPIYFNFYDSIVFLNEVKGSKIVVSKGFDEYIKKNKIIVKSDGYYYNVFCKDLYSNYAVGDTIP